MSKETKNAETPATIEKEVTEVQLGGKILNVEELFEAMEGMEPGEIISNEYFTMEPGESVKAIFSGMTKMKKMNTDDEMIDAVKLMIKEGKYNKINADKVLVSACRDLPVPTMLSITCIGKVKSAKGQYKDFEVRKLN
jgi:hypothetical protein